MVDDMVEFAVILAAGMGTRLAGVLDDRPKGFLEIEGESLIERSVGLLKHYGVTSIVIVAGYRSEYYKKFAETHDGVRVVENPMFAESGSMYSLYCAVDCIEAPFYLLESDLIYESRALETLVENGPETAVLMSGLTGAGDEVYVSSPDGMLENMSKQPESLSEISGELVGICTVDCAVFSEMLAVSKAYFKNDLFLDYEFCLVKCAEKMNIQTVYVPDLLWSEIDESAHLERVLNVVLPQIREKEQKRG